MRRRETNLRIVRVQSNSIRIATNTKGHVLRPADQERLRCGGGPRTGAAIVPYQLPPGWDTAIKGWLTWLQIAGIATTTMRLRRDHVRAIARRSRTLCPDELTLGMLVALCSETAWSNDHRKGVRTSLSSFYEWAMANGAAADNPAARMPRVRESKPHPRPAPDSVWEHLLAAAGPRERLMALLAGEAGLRRAEVAQCHRDDLIEDLYGWSLLVRGKGDKQRIVPITNRLASEIRTFCATGYLFPGVIGGHISAPWVGTVISNLMPDGWSIHKLRHRYATLGYAGTQNLRAVQEALGHASVATTQRYTAVSSREVRSVSEAASHHHGDGAA
jgi:integrase